MPALSDLEVLDGGSALRVTWDQGLSARFHAIWLRDNAQDGQTRDRANGQRLITLQQVPKDTAIAEARIEGSAVQIRFQPEGKGIAFESAWLQAHIYDRAPRDEAPKPACEVETWDGQIDPARVTGDYRDLVSDRTALRRWLGHVRRYGFARLTGGPVEPQALLKVAALFGYVRETNYGRWFEVRSEIAPSNLAYTGLGLQAHTDNPYRDPQPTLQILYCLENAASGGDNLVVDGFRVAERLYGVGVKGPAKLGNQGLEEQRLPWRSPAVRRAEDPLNLAGAAAQLKDGVLAA